MTETVEVKKWGRETGTFVWVDLRTRIGVRGVCGYPLPPKGDRDRVGEGPGRRVSRRFLQIVMLLDITTKDLTGISDLMRKFFILYVYPILSFPC